LFDKFVSVLSFQIITNPLKNKKSIVATPSIMLRVAAGLTFVAWGEGLNKFGRERN
jgi:hypothetical protein